MEYFREHMAVGDYMGQEGCSEMTWIGSGAGRLGLHGRCDLAHFENLCRGRHPLTGEKLMVRDKGRHRRVGYFGQISPPKDVSLLYLVGGDQRIGDWWREAVTQTLREIEAVTATRVRRAGANADRSTGMPPEVRRLLESDVGARAIEAGCARAMKPSRAAEHHSPSNWL